MFKHMMDLSDITTVILAGGFGTRLRSLLPDKPKVIAPILGRPFLTFLLDQLVMAGAEKTVLCTGYMAHEVQKQLGYSYKALELIYSREDVPLDTGGALRFALPYLNSDTILVMNGDSFVNIDLTVYLNWFHKKRCKASLLLVNVSDTGRYGRVVVSKDGLVSGFEEKGLNHGAGWINAGVYIINKSLIEAIPVETPFSLERKLFPKLVGKEIYGFQFKGEFIDIGTPESFASADKFFLSI